MVPLAFTEDDNFGLQPYQQFERLEHEYETLAEKKRKVLSSPHHHQRLDGHFDMEDGLRQESTFPPNFKKRGRQKGSKNKLNRQVTRKLGDATLHYAHGRYEETIGPLVVVAACNAAVSFVLNEDDHQRQIESVNQDDIAVIEFFEVEFSNGKGDWRTRYSNKKPDRKTPLCNNTRQQSSRGPCTRAPADNWPSGRHPMVYQ
ncbi:hypothetical protein U1Q18_010867 [Sarracenia purpurea var. burkii]